jgi:hypothetical protein
MRKSNLIPFTPLEQRLTITRRTAPCGGCPEGAIRYCSYHLGHDHDGRLDLQLVQLTHNSRDSSAWQTPIAVCRDCRDYLRFRWRYRPAAPQPEEGK